MWAAAVRWIIRIGLQGNTICSCCTAGMDFHELLDIPQGDRRRYHDDVSVIIISFEGRIWRSSMWSLYIQMLLGSELLGAHDKMKEYCRSSSSSGSNFAIKRKWYQSRFRGLFLQFSSPDLWSGHFLHMILDAARGNMIPLLGKFHGNQNFFWPLETQWHQHHGHTLSRWKWRLGISFFHILVLKLAYQGTGQNVGGTHLCSRGVVPREDLEPNMRSHLRGRDDRLHCSPEPCQIHPSRQTDRDSPCLAQLSPLESIQIWLVLTLVVLTRRENIIPDINTRDDNATGALFYRRGRCAHGTTRYLFAPD